MTTPDAPLDARTCDALSDALRTIDALVDQQAMPDPFWMSSRAFIESVLVQRLNPSPAPLAAIEERPVVLPPLPPRDEGWHSYTQDQTEEYARAAVCADRAARPLDPSQHEEGE